MKLLRLISFATMSLAAASSVSIPVAGASSPRQAHTAPAPSSRYSVVQPAVFAPGLQNASPYDYFLDVSCAAPGDCTAVGQFFAADDDNQAMTQTSTNGVWAPAQPANFGDDFPTPYRNGAFTSVSCTSRGNCTAVGYTGNLAIAQTLTNGVWGHVVVIPFSSSILRSPDGPNDHLYSISCSSPGNCTAAGDYGNENGYDVPMTAQMIGGVWGPATPGLFPSNYDLSPNASYTKISCASAGNCTAAGSYYRWPTGMETYLSTSTAGAWSTAVVVPNFQMMSLSCSGPGSCTASGHTTDSNGGTIAATVSSTNGIWGSLDVLELPYPNSALISVDCTAPGSCTAVGYYDDADWHSTPVMETSVGGVWLTPVIGVTVTEGSSSDPAANGLLASVSCTSAGYCSAAGSTYDGNGGAEGITITQTKGSWSAATTASFSPSVSGQPRGDAFYTISCSAPGSCTAAGNFTDVNNNYPAMTQTFMAPPPSAPQNVSFSPAPGHAIVNWSAPANLNGASVTGYRVTVRRASNGAVQRTVEVSASPTQAIITLPVSSFTFSVAALTTSGVGDASEPLTASTTASTGVRIPPAPRALTAVVANGSARLSWLPPVLSDGGSLIYQYIVSDGHGRGCVSGSDARFAATQFTCSVTGLTNGSRYSFSVTAVNIMGSSQPSPVAVVSPASPPTSAPMVSIDSLTMHRATLDVTAPRDMGGRALLGYEASFDNGRTWMSLHYFTSGNQIQLGALTPGNSYRVLIRARNQVGTSPSAVVNFTLPRH